MNKPMKHTAIRLDRKLIRAIENETRRNGRTKSEIVRMALRKRYNIKEMT